MNHPATHETTALMPWQDSRLASLAAKLLAIAIRRAEEASNPDAVAEAASLHAAEKLYPELTIRMPHGGRAIKLSLTLRDPDTNKVVVRMLEIEGQSAEAVWN